MWVGAYKREAECVSGRESVCAREGVSVGCEKERDCVEECVTERQCVCERERECVCVCLVEPVCLTCTRRVSM